MLGTWRTGRNFPTARTISVIDSASHLICGLRADGTAECWGYDNDGQASAPDGKFSVVKAGYDHSCGLRTDGTAECWGAGYQPPAGSSAYTAPEGEFVSVGVQPSYACGVRTDGDLLCWGSDYATSGEAIGEGFAMVDAGDEVYCGLRLDGSVKRRGNYGLYLASERVHISEVTPSGHDFTSVTVGARHACGVRRNGTVACWGDNYDYHPHCHSDALGMPICGFEAQGDYYGHAESPEGIFTAVNAGTLHTCGLRPDGTAECWGDDTFGQSTPPGGAFAAITAGYAHTCGIRTDGAVECWGGGAAGDDSVLGTYETNPDGTVAELAVHSSEGGEKFVLRPPANSTFVSLAAGKGYTCGVRTDRTVKCWGSIAR